MIPSSRTLRVAAAVLSLLGASIPCARAGEPGAARGVGCIGLTVSDADRAAAFYVRVLDFRRERESEVAGEAWERLQGVFGLRARTVRVRLGAECLDLTEYLAPRDGRPYPEDERANDLVHWQTPVRVADVDAAASAARAAGRGWISPGPVAVEDGRRPGVSRALLARDPDGHVVELSEASTDQAWSAR